MDIFGYLKRALIIVNQISKIESLTEYKQKQRFKSLFLLIFMRRVIGVHSW